MINLVALNYALMISFLVINIATFVHNFRVSIKTRTELSNIPSFYAETELMHWSLYGSMVLPIVQDVSAKDGFIGYFIFAGVLVLMTVVAIVIGTHRQWFDRLLSKGLTDDKNSRKDRSK